jgi:DNA-binding response OmpR family regulator
MKILVVCDTRITLSLLRDYLVAGGNFLVEGATSVEEAEGRIHNGRYDAIMSEFKIGNSNGVRLLKTLRDSDENEHTPFIMFTTFTDEALREMHGLKVSPDFLLQKDDDFPSCLSDMATTLKEGGNLEEVEFKNICKMILV